MHAEYLKRINKVLAYIDDNLQSDLSLNSIALVGNYSPFHLHRLFKAITNETINNYIIRKRIEKSVFMLIHQADKSISEIAIKNGFKNDSTYSRTFKKVYGRSPLEFRKLNYGNFSKIGKEDSKNGQIDFLSEQYICNVNNLLKWVKMKAIIEIREMPQLNLAYITQIGEEGIERTFFKLVNWANTKGILNRKGANVCRVFHDSFKITDSDKVRMSIGVCTEADIVGDDAVSLGKILGGRTIVGSFVIDISEFENAWNSLFIWMNENGYQKSELNPYELYYNNYLDHPEKKYIVDFCIPVF